MSFELEVGRGNQGKPTLVGKIFGCFFFSLFAAFGVFFTYLIADDVLSSYETYSWAEGRCEIIKSAVVQKSEDYELSATFKVLALERTAVSHTYSSKGYTSSSYSELQRLAERLTPGATTNCYYPPLDPERAIIERPSLWFGLVIFFPLIFVAVGLGGIYFTFKSKPELKEAQRSISQKAKQEGKFGWIGALVFFGAFALLGGAGSYFFLVKPLIGIVAAQSWSTQQCTVLSSKVKSHHSDDGTTYSVDILYKYFINGKEYKSNRYDFMGGSSSGYESKKKIVRQHPRGKQIKCHVDPDDPFESVIQPGLSWIFLVGAIPLLFFAIGVGGLWYSFRPKKDSTQLSGAYGADTSSHYQIKSWGEPGNSDRAQGKIVLKPSVSPLGKFIGITIVAGIFGGAEYFMLNELSSSFDYGLVFFVAIWSLFVLGLFAMVVYQLLALINPRPRIEIDSSGLRIGEDYTLSWTFAGKASMIAKLEIYLIGSEAATYQRGTDSITENNTFHHSTIVSLQNKMQMSNGTANLKIPDNVMPTFNATNNKIAWTIRLHGDIPNWPDVDESMKIDVLSGRRT